MNIFLLLFWHSMGYHPSNIITALKLFIHPNCVMWKLFDKIFIRVWVFLWMVSSIIDHSNTQNSLSKSNTHLINKFMIVYETIITSIKLYHQLKVREGQSSKIYFIVPHDSVKVDNRNDIRRCEKRWKFELMKNHFI